MNHKLVFKTIQTAVGQQTSTIMTKIILVIRWAWFLNLWFYNFTSVFINQKCNINTVFSSSYTDIKVEPVRIWNRATQRLLCSVQTWPSLVFCSCYWWLKVRSYWFLQPLILWSNNVINMEDYTVFGCFIYLFIMLLNTDFIVIY